MICDGLSPKYLCGDAFIGPWKHLSKCYYSSIYVLQNDIGRMDSFGPLNEVGGFKDLFDNLFAPGEMIQFFLYFSNELKAPTSEHNHLDIFISSTLHSCFRSVSFENLRNL